MPLQQANRQLESLVISSFAVDANAKKTAMHASAMETVLVAIIARDAEMIIVESRELLFQSRERK